MTARYRGFTQESLRFLQELAANNNRDWFQQHKKRYEDEVLDSALLFIQNMQQPLADIAPSFVALPTRVGGSLMRIYRDTRFARDKTPYKTNIGIQFRHEQAKDVHAPGYYLHIDPEQVFVGVGMWRPEPDALRGIRERIAAKPAEWRRIVDAKEFGRYFALAGESLSRPPRGFARDHQCIADIRRKSFIAVREFDVGDCLKPRFQQSVETTFRKAEPFMRFLCAAVDVRF